MSIYSCFEYITEKPPHKMKKTILVAKLVCNSLGHKLRTTQILQHHYHFVIIIIIIIIITS